MEKITIKKTKLYPYKQRHLVDGYITPDYTGKHGIKFDGTTNYITVYSKRVMILLRVVKFIQKILWIFGIAIHDPIFGECTPDFNCCNSTIGRWAFINIKKNSYIKRR